MRIGEVAITAGLPAQTIRFYERKGLLARPQRDSNGYRSYNPSVLSRLGFIRNAQGAGLTLAEIGTVLDLREEGASPCAHVSELLSNKLGDVWKRQAELVAVAVELEELIRRGDLLDPAQCTDAEICHIIGLRTGEAESARTTLKLT